MKFFKITDLENEKKLWLKFSILFLACSSLISMINLFYLNLNISAVLIVSATIFGFCISFFPIYYLAYKKNGVKYLIFYMLFSVVALISTAVQSSYSSLWMLIPGALYLYMNVRLFIALKKSETKKPLSD